MSRRADLQPVDFLALGGADDFGITDDSQWNCDATGANAVQDAARLAARELALAPVRANVTFDFALSCDPTSDGPNCLVDLRRRVFDPACLVVDFSDQE